MTLTKDQLQGTHTQGGVPVVLVTGVGDNPKPHFVNEHEYNEKKHGEQLDLESQPVITVSGLPRQKYDEYGKPVLKSKEDPTPVLIPAHETQILKIMYDESVHGTIIKDAEVIDEDAAAPEAPASKKRRAAK